ncbi:MAG: methyltransferase type 12 [Burkholderiales bacterium]|nr:MAG: methyltransferase type 12 [Burkholderiales bacterium]
MATYERISEAPQRQPRRTHPLAFLIGFLRRPMEVASVIPSSRFLEQAIVRACNAARADVIVELGPGTGGTTRALLAALPEHGRLLAIELIPDFAAMLGEIEDNRLRVHCGSAEDIGLALEKAGLPAPDVVVSGIPFSTMPHGTGQRIVGAIRAQLAPGGCFVAYQARDAVARLATPAMGPPRSEMAWLNIPPMRVFRWDKPVPQPAAHATAAAAASEAVLEAASGTHG